MSLTRLGLWSLQGLNGKGRASKLTHEVGLDSVLGGSWQEAVLCPCDVGLSIYCLVVTQACQTL